MNFVRCCCWLLCSVQLLFVEINFYHNLLALGGEGERNFAVYLSRLNSISQVSVKKESLFLSSSQKLIFISLCRQMIIAKERAVDIKLPFFLISLILYHSLIVLNEFDYYRQLPSQKDETRFFFFSLSLSNEKYFSLQSVIEFFSFFFISFS